MKHPSRTSYAWVTLIKEMSFWLLLLVLFILYASINCFFATTYYAIGALKPEATLLDYFYFSFITALTIGYGDFSPLTNLGKIVVILHSCITAIYFAIMITALSAKMFFPRNTIYFSNMILYDPFRRRMGIRIINTHRERLINPEIRITMTEHCAGNVMATNFRIRKIDDLPYLGRHDFTVFFPSHIRLRKHFLSISDQQKRALEHDENNEVKSRFRITISITGNYGIQQIAFYKKYYPGDFDIGSRFKIIKYNDEDQRQWGNIRYTKFPNFWKDFHSIKPLPKIYTAVRTNKRFKVFPRHY